MDATLEKTKQQDKLKKAEVMEAFKSIYQKNREDKKKNYKSKT